MPSAVAGRGTAGYRLLRPMRPDRPSVGTQGTAGTRTNASTGARCRLGAERSLVQIQSPRLRRPDTGRFRRGTATLFAGCSQSQGSVLQVIAPLLLRADRSSSALTAARICFSSCVTIESVNGRDARSSRFATADSVSRAETPGFVRAARQRRAPAHSARTGRRRFHERHAGGRPQYRTFENQAPRGSW